MFYFSCDAYVRNPTMYYGEWESALPAMALFLIPISFTIGVESRAYSLVFGDMSVVELSFDVGERYI